MADLIYTASLIYLANLDDEAGVPTALFRSAEAARSFLENEVGDGVIVEWEETSDYGDGVGWRCQNDDVLLIVAEYVVIS